MRTVGQTDTTQLLGAFGDYVNPPEKKWVIFLQFKSATSYLSQRPLRQFHYDFRHLSFSYLHIKDKEWVVESCDYSQMDNIGT